MESICATVSSCCLNFSTSDPAVHSGAFAAESACVWKGRARYPAGEGAWGSGHHNADGLAHLKT